MGETKKPAPRPEPQQTTLRLVTDPGNVSRRPVRDRLREYGNPQMVRRPRTK